MIELTLFFVVYLVLNAYENYLREKWKYDKIEKQVKWSRKWHTVQFIRWSFVFITVSLLIFGLNYKLMTLFLFGVIWWILFDGLLNIFRGKKFFEQSKHRNLSALEKYATKTNKLLLLLIAVLLTIIWSILHG